MRGATKIKKYLDEKGIFSIHTPHAGSDKTALRLFRNFIFSIHTPHAGSDRADGLQLALRLVFQSTLPMRGATPVLSLFALPLFFQSTLPMRGATGISISKRYDGGFSIHTPHAGSDHRRK